jgi:hypothetical protein
VKADVEGNASLQESAASSVMHFWQGKMSACCGILCGGEGASMAVLVQAQCG